MSANDKSNLKVPLTTVAQLGARRHYAVPRILNDAGILSNFYTDICGVVGWPRAFRFLPRSMQPPYLRRLLGRVPQGIPRNRISSIPTFGLRLHLRRRRSDSRIDRDRTYLWAGQTFARRVVKIGLVDTEAVYTFNGSALEILQAAAFSGLTRFHEQTMAPYRVEDSLLLAEEERWPDWCCKTDKRVNSYRKEIYAREEAEWDLSNRILCGSEFVRHGIQVCGGPASKCIVVPYGVDTMRDMAVRPFNRKGTITKPGSRKLRVLTVGAAGLRKGTPYVMEAARLIGCQADVRLVGLVDIPDSARKQLSQWVDVRGPVPRSEVSAHFYWADVFLLPSLCEGSSIAVYEALAHGLPIIGTDNAGTVVTHNYDGYIVPVRDAYSIADHLTFLADNPDERQRLGQNALRTASQHDLTGYRKNLLIALRDPT